MHNGLCSCLYTYHSESVLILNNDGYSSPPKLFDDGVKDGYNVCLCGQELEVVTKPLTIIQYI